MMNKLSERAFVWMLTSLAALSMGACPNQDVSIGKVNDRPDASTSDSSSGCTGTAPNCFGSDLPGCCGQDPFGVATCNGSEWMCGTVAAPGCDGTSCVQPQDAGTTDSGSGCAGTAPFCFGSDLADCCGNDPAGVASCNGSQWMCGTAAAPGCNGTSCLQPQDAGMSDSGSGCTGTAPLCFGSDLADCCGNDPAGVATCNGNQWMCGTVAAPGCNGTSCLQPQDAGTSDSGGGCAGTAPNCFGTDLAGCCGQDPFGVATCNGNQWMCGTVAAPGCNGTKCI